MYSPACFHDLTKYRLLLFLFHSLEIISVHFMYSYDNNNLLVVQSSSPAADRDVKNKMFIGPLSVNMQRSSLSCSQSIENTELPLPVPLCFVH